METIKKTGEYEYILEMKNKALESLINEHKQLNFDDIDIDTVLEFKRKNMKLKV